MNFSTRRLLIGLVVAHAAALAGGVLAGMSLSRDLPGIDHLDVMNLPQRTVLRDRDGAFLHAFAEQKRIPVTLEQVAPEYVQAVIATEDPRFYDHIGVDLIAVGRAVWATVRELDFGVEGASTITMQLARLQFLHPKKTISRKIQQAVLATQIERNYSKEEILTFYLNRIYLGHGTYGVEAASRYYFGKPAAELALGEAALLAGLGQRPSALSPVRHPDRALRRRNYVLRRMVAEGLLDEETGRVEMERPIVLSDEAPVQPVGRYFVEEVRRWIAGRFGEAALYREGLVVQTTLHTRYQIAAERAVRFGLDEYGRRHKELPVGAPLPEDVTAADYHDTRWNGAFVVNDIVPAVVLEAGPKEARLRVKDAHLTLGRAAMSWTGEKRPDRLLTPGTIVPVRVTGVTADGAPEKIELGSSPTPEAALFAIDAASGDVLSLVGGSDFDKSEFDRAMQARRQAGSAFKPFIYAAALEMGLLPTQTIYDAPTVLVDPGQELPYQPENFERDYQGFVTMRHSLEHSRNIPTVRLLDTIGYRPAVDIAKRLGIATTLQPYPSLALGAFEVQLSDLVAAYAAFVNGGVLVRPTLVREVAHAERQEMWQASDEAREVLAPEVAAMVASMLEGVVQHGTGRSALALGRPLGGKTGTTDDYTDAWFVGFTPSMAVGVWVGHDKKRTLGKKETGARAALPIWKMFLDLALADEPVEEFVRPPGVRRALVDGTTGRIARPGIGCQSVVLESFPPGREAVETCDWRAHARRQLPYPLQPYELDESGALRVLPDDLARLVTAVPARLRLVGGGRALQFRWGERSGTVPLAWSHEDWLRYVERLPITAATAGLRAQERSRFVEEYEAPEDGPTVEEALPAHLRDGVDGVPAEVLEVNRTGRIRLPGDRRGATP